MKKMKSFFCACIALVVFVNASVWEGGAVAVSSGELPENGFFIATNSFPVNTVVDVTNLENGKTIRVVVSAGLDTPGLLALLSNDTANAIELPVRSLGRIRMSQPADSVAFSRFSEGLSTSGDPDYDPAAFVAMNGFDPSSFERGVNPSGETGAGDTGEGIIDLGEIGRIGAVVEEAPEAAVIPAPAEPAATPLPAAPIVSVPAEPVVATAPLSAAPVVATPAEPALTTAPLPAASVVSTSPPPAVPDLPSAPPLPAPIAELPEEEAALPETPVFVPAVPGASLLPDTPSPRYDLSLVPSESRPPEISPEPNPDDFIPGIVPPAPPADASIDPSLIIDPVNPALAAAVPAAGLTPNPDDFIPEIVPPAPPADASIDPSMFIDSVRTSVVPSTAEVFPLPFSTVVEPPASYAPHFSVPTISTLQSGKYYLQIAAYSMPETVESEIAKIDNRLPVVIMEYGSAEEPVYRILIGPLNLGESGAMLQRFKANYRDAFVRLGGT